MRLVITGALGHIGSFLIRELSLPGFQSIDLIDNLATQRYASLFNLPDRCQYCFYERDILSDQIEEVISKADCLIHLAAITDAESSIHQEEVVKKVNEGGLAKLATWCARHKVPIIFPSTTSVYGTQEEVVDENCPLPDLKPQSPYAASKLHGERLLQDFGKEEGLEFVVLRLGTIFGFSVGMRFHTAVNKFIWQALKGESLTIWKTALHQKRPYCGLGDCKNAIETIIKGNQFDGEVYNIVSENTSVQEVIDLIQKNIQKVDIKMVDSPIMNQLSYEVSNEKSKRIGMKYSDQLNKSIQDTIERLRCSSKAIY